MTLVASFAIDNHPIVLGDLMLSIDDNGANYRPFTTPLHVDPNREVRGKQSRIVWGLTQKVNVLTPRLVVAWAGTMHEAEDALPRLRDDVAGAGYTVSSLQKSLRGLSMSHKRLYLNGFITLADHGPEIPVVAFSWPDQKGKRFASHLFGECHIGGTGANDFEQLIRMREGLEINVYGQPNECQKAIGEALLMAARLSGDQMRLGTGLQEFYGGGFEIATLSGGAFTKVGEISYHLLDATWTAHAQVKITPHCVLTYSYDGDLLLVRKIEPARAPTPSTDETFVLSPVHKRLSEDERHKLAERIKVPPLDWTFEVFYLHLPQAPPGSRITIWSHYLGASGTPWVQYRELDDSLELELHPELLNRVAAAVQRAIARKQ